MENRGGANRNQGRKSKDEEKRIRELTSPYCSDSINTIVNILKDKEAKDSDRIAAAKLILAYTYGQPTQTVDQKNTHTLNDFSIKSLYDTKAQK